MADWTPAQADSSPWIEHLQLCEAIAAASDRAAIGRLPPTTDLPYNRQEGLKIHHLLSGEAQTLKLGETWQQNLTAEGRDGWLSARECAAIPEAIKQESDPRKVFWWLWRCYPEVLGDPKLALLPAENRLPDGSIWSNATMTSALAGALGGYYPEAAGRETEEDSTEAQNFPESRPYLAIFSFVPIQEVVKASRKMRDFWAGSWVLHYLAAKVCWKLAWKYGPDALLYPCLYAQPLIDLWLLQAYPDFKQWLELPLNRRLLTAGIPNVLVTLLPDNGAGKSSGESSKSPVQAAMQMAEETLSWEWLDLGGRVLKYLQEEKHWMPDLNRPSWDEWLQSQWQIYSAALPLGDRASELHQSPASPAYKNWIGQQDKFAHPKSELGVERESQFLQKTHQIYQNNPQAYLQPPNLNVGSWWASIFAQTRSALSGIKTGRTWQLPTAFAPRSSISGLGPAVHRYPQAEGEWGTWTTEAQVKAAWQERAGLFNGRETLNPTEVLKRGLEKILPEVLLNEDNTAARFDNYYPDLNSGVAGWLRTHPEMKEKYQEVCQQVEGQFSWVKKQEISQQPWGIPWTERQSLPNPRLLNAGWLIEDFSAGENSGDNDKSKKDELKELKQFLGCQFPGSNPTDWYVLAAGDGDSMGSWLTGERLDQYNRYIPEALHPKISGLPKELQAPLNQFLQEKKRMGPASYSALSRALLDFSNQLLPYLTEERYAGRLIYGGGDDVLAYTNLWEWDRWLWDIRQCFRGQKDPQEEFDNSGDYWHLKNSSLITPNSSLSHRPLFTMGSQATISFGVAIANQGVPLAIALENLWEAEEEAKGHQYHSGCFLENSLENQAVNLQKQYNSKDAVQVRVLYSSGNILKATAKFDVFSQWQQLLDLTDIESSLFEQAATVWKQHPAPVSEAIAPWTIAFCRRREQLKQDKANQFQAALANFLDSLWLTTPAEDLEREVHNWLKLAAFIRRTRQIEINLGGEP
jgi:CRISPR-associated protein Cmr2